MDDLEDYRLGRVIDQLLATIEDECDDLEREACGSC
jgi:hypothetical protein